MILALIFVVSASCSENQRRQSSAAIRVYQRTILIE
jgi:hypothetical protein